MKFGGMGLQGKFVVALLVAAALPFVVGLVVFESNGYQHLLRERGKFHQMEALALARALDQASVFQGEILSTWLAADPATAGFASAQNEKSNGLEVQQIAERIRRLDEMWTSLPGDDPQLLAVLDNSVSANLRKYQSLHPEVAELMATDIHGALIAATGKTSDYDQSDEDWWRRGIKLQANQQWTDALRFDASSDVFSLDVVCPLYHAGKIAGVVKMAVDVTSLFSKLKSVGENPGERWEIVLPDRWVLASSKPDFSPLNDRLSEAAMDEILTTRTGWSLLQSSEGEARMTGFVSMGEPGPAPNGYVLFSSSRDEVVGPLQKSFLQIGLAASALLTLCTLAGFYLIRRNILQPLSALAKAARSVSVVAGTRSSRREDDEHMRDLREFAEEELRKIKDIRTGDEVEALASDFAVMSSRVLQCQRELESEVAAKTSVIREDLELAREFQNALLPDRYPEIPAAHQANPLRLQFAHFYQPASTVGGDFFDLIELDENRAGILIADVMGHGARSALVTAILRALVRNRSHEASSPGDFLSDLNRHLLEVISRSGQTLFVTAFFLILDTRNSKATWSVAGHPSPLRVHRGSGRLPEELWSEPQHQPALGLVANAGYRTSETSIRPGDVFLLFTDGAVEAENPAGENFGITRLGTSFDAALDGPMAAMPAKIVCDVTSFQRRRHYDDDVCLVVVEVLKGATELPDHGSPTA